MDRATMKKLITTGILLVVIDRMEFMYSPFQGLERYVPFACCHEPIQLSWWVYLVGIQIQYLLFTVVLYLWLPMQKEFKWVVIAFGLCVIELPLTYGRPIMQLPLPWQWYFPLSCSMLRLASIIYFLSMVLVRSINEK
jgi:hypothetical protein